MRLFIGVNFPEIVIAKLCSLQDELRKNVKSGRFTSHENMHLTLQFLGEMPEDRCREIIPLLESEARNNQSFMLSFDRLGYFGRGNPIPVVWLGIQGDLSVLGRLQSGIVAAMQGLGFKDEGRFHPHVTLARQVEFIQKEVVQKQGGIDIEVGKFPVFTVDYFSLLSSSREQGRLRYHKLATFQLNN